MSAKPKPKITMGKYNGQEVTITKKKGKPGFLVVKLTSGKEIQVHKNFIQ